MATFYGDNVNGSRQTTPHDKYPPGEKGGMARLLIDKKTLVDAAGTAGLDANDEILLGYLPKGAKVVWAVAKIDKSLGATGIFSLGFKATKDEDGNTLAEDADAFIDSIDGGGQAVMATPQAGAAGVFRRFGAETRVFLKCTEVMDDSVLDAVIDVAVWYVVN